MRRDVSKGIDSAVAIVTGIITGDITGGLAGAGAPWVAEQIKLHTGHAENGEWKTDSPVANLVAHAILGAVVAELQGHSGVVGGASAVSGELAAKVIRDTLYNKDVKDLTEEEKQNISALTQLAVGLTIASMGGDTGDIATGIDSSKNAVENNYLNSSDHQDKVGLEYKEKRGELTDEEKLRLAELRVKDELSTDALLEACVDINSDACQVERQKAYEALKTYQHLSYLNPPESQDGYQEIKHLLEGTSNSPEANQLRIIYDGYVASYKRFGYDEEDARIMAGRTMGTMMILNGVTSGFTISKINKIFGNSKLLNAGKGTKGQIIKNSDGLNEVKINQTPSEGQNRLNTPDLGGNGKLNPAEAAAARMETVLGKMQRLPEDTLSGKSADYIIISGPNKGKTVDLMYTTKNLSQKEIDGINKFYEKNMTLPPEPGTLPKGKQQILDHLDKADFVPVDFKVLNSKNQKIFTDFIKTLPKSLQNKIIIMR